MIPGHGYTHDELAQMYAQGRLVVPPGPARSDHNELARMYAQANPARPNHYEWFSPVPKLGYYDCPTHGVVDYEPCPICKLGDGPENFYEEDVYQPLSSLICDTCGCKIEDHFYTQYDFSLLFCRHCADQYRVKQAGPNDRDPHWHTWGPKPPKITDTSPKPNPIQDLGPNPSVAMDGLASFVRRRVIPDIKEKRQKRRGLT